MSALRRLDQFTFHHALADTSGPSLVLFTAPACGACRRVKGILAQLPFRDLTLFEVDAGLDMALTREFEVFHLPALFLFRDGRYHRPVHAEAAATALRAAVDAALAAPAEEAP
jgi:thioredoxin-like negative regulator of GroEL